MGHWEKYAVEMHELSIYATGRRIYFKQTSRTAFNQYAVNSDCMACLIVPETCQYFIAECAFFKLH